MCDLARALFLLLLVGVAQVSQGQQVDPASASVPVVEQELTVEQIEILCKESEESPELDNETRKTVAEIYESALSHLKRASEFSNYATRFKEDAEKVEQRVGQVQKRLKQVDDQESIVPEGASLAELEPLLSKLELQLSGHKKAQSDAKSVSGKRTERRKEIRSRLVQIPEEIAALKSKAKTLATNEPSFVIAARKTEVASQLLALESEFPALENELTRLDAEDATGLLQLERDLCTRQAALSEKQVQLVKEQVRKARATVTEQALHRARDEAITADSVLQSYAERNQHLAEEAKSIIERFNAADVELKKANADYERLLSQFKQTREKVDSVGLTNAIGALLRKQRAGLPDILEYRAAVSTRRTTIDDAQYELFEYDDERQELANPETLIQKVISSAGPRSVEQLKVLKSASQDVLERKREYLDALLRGYNKYFDCLVELDTTEQQVVVLSGQYRKYIDERVLWIRSGNVLTSELEFDQSDIWFISARRWAEIPRRLAADVGQHPAAFGLALLCFIVLAVQGKRLRQELDGIGDTAQKPTCCQFKPTLRVAAMTTVIAAIWPALTALVAWRLKQTAGESSLVAAVGHGLLCVCATWFPLELFRQICRRQGLAEAHFGWPSSATLLLRQNLRWLIGLVLPLTFITSSLAAGDPTHGRDAVERACFLVQAIVLAVFIRRVLRPQGGVFQQYVAYHQGSWVDRLKYVWFWVGIAGPLSIAILAFWGYYYTAQVLSWRLYATLCFVASLVVVRALLLRLIMLRRRKLSIEQSRQRAASNQEASDSQAVLSQAATTPQTPGLELSTHSAQTQRLLATGMFATTLIGFWLIWVEVLPALSMLDQWPLWTTTTTAQVVDQAPRSGDSLQKVISQVEQSPIIRTEIQETRITFSNLALAILVAIITLMSARNVPGLLEMSVLQRLPLDASIRYATTTLVSYAIVLFGVVVACSNLGLRWSQIQWLATALTFGLAFGLQEIFANFVAGIIILFERPVRVGDVVTIDDVTGIVSKIRIRATSITNWDRKEYVVPNKEFITGRLLNWTLSDQTNRIVINVGVAYGSDTARTTELLLQVAHEHALILKDPPSLATFEGFGDNSLNFTLRTFLPSMENRLQVIHELHVAIDRAFREAGIEIAFPQRDLHIRSVPEALAVAATEQRDSGIQSEAA